MRSGCAWRLLPHEFRAWQTALDGDQGPRRSFARLQQTAKEAAVADAHSAQLEAACSCISVPINVRTAFAMLVVRALVSPPLPRC
jgi:hypothetical protein